MRHHPKRWKTISNNEQWWVLSSLLVAIILRYMQILNHHVVCPKLALCINYTSIFKKMQSKGQSGLQNVFAIKYKWQKSYMFGDAQCLISFWNLVDLLVLFHLPWLCHAFYRAAFLPYIINVVVIILPLLLFQVIIFSFLLNSESGEKMFTWSPLKMCNTLNFSIKWNRP